MRPDSRPLPTILLIIPWMHDLIVDFFVVHFVRSFVVNYSEQWHYGGVPLLWYLVEFVRKWENAVWWNNLTTE